MSSAQYKYLSVYLLEREISSEASRSYWTSRKARITKYSVLPAPSIFMLNKKGQVLFSYVNPDFKVRPSADLVLAVAKTLKKEM
ncbi:hypothetical protein [Alteromonas sp. CyTr2]|uniref:hypothetical protein n=1 Tax=Alteromonas sp. CyTr2 TaxID=2935039 RepID=UPI00248E6564|nr:hypothetical protein [Alteromonas sp. CyTr2]